VVRGESDPETQKNLVRQIGFAERWLVRAKQEVSAGNRARSVLNLLLAEAEVHHARETTAPAREMVLPRPAPLVTVLGIAFLAALLLAVPVLLAPPDFSTEVATTAAVIRFKQQVGSTLALIPVVAAPAPPAVQTSPVAPAAPRAVPRPALRPAAPRLASARPVVIIAAPPPPLVSDTDLIDLVLAAERSLRGERR